MPGEYLFITTSVIFILNPLISRPNIIPQIHPKTKKTVLIPLERFFVLPREMRFDERAITQFRAIERYVLSLRIRYITQLLLHLIHTHITLHTHTHTHNRLIFLIFILFGSPILAGIFYNSGFVLQACIVPLFFGLRATFEYAADFITSRKFGSDAMPVVNFQGGLNISLSLSVHVSYTHTHTYSNVGVLNHEICLSFMMTNINHPVVFVLLVCGDVFENAVCLYFLHRTISSSSSKISPESSSSSLEQKTMLEKRTSRTMSLIKDYHQQTHQRKSGTALFIASTLLQREMVETMIPIQFLGLISILYFFDVNSNSITSNWNGSQDYIQTLMYTFIDLAVELVVFFGA